MWHQRISCAPLCCALAAVALLLSACGSAPLPGALSFPFERSYNNARHTKPVLLENTLWWQQLEDQTLNTLVEAALADNLSLAAARERVEAGRLAMEVVGAPATLTSSAGVRAEGAGSDSPDTNARGQLGLSWMFDPWGARRNQLRAAAAQAKAAQAEEDAAHLLVLFNVTNTYAELRYRQQLLHLAEQDLANATRTEKLLQRLQSAGEATRLDVTRAAARSASLRSTLPELKANITAQANALSVLAGKAPGTLSKELTHALRLRRAQPRIAMAPEVGIPADLLRNRPDIIILEQNYAEAVAEIGIAQAALYPSLSLSGLISIDTLGSDANRPQYFLGPAINFPALPLASGRARVTQSHALARAVHEDWKQTILSAVLEVENALVDYAAVSRGLQSAQRAVRLHEETERLTRELLNNGEVTVTDVIIAQQDLTDAQRTLAELRFRRMRGFVDINIGLGAGRDARAR